MIVLDTNVVSEALRPEPHSAVRLWLNDQGVETLYLSSVTLADLLFGIAALPAGKRRDMLGQALDGLTGLFRDRVLPFDSDAARATPNWRSLRGAREEVFRPLTAISPRLPFRAASAWHHVTRRLTRQPGSR